MTAFGHFHSSLSNRAAVGRRFGVYHPDSPHLPGSVFYWTQIGGNVGQSGASASVIRPRTREHLEGPAPATGSPCANSSYHKSRRGRDCVCVHLPPPPPSPPPPPLATPSLDLHLQRACDRDRCTYMIAADERKARRLITQPHTNTSWTSFIEFAPFIFSLNCNYKGH